MKKHILCEDSGSGFLFWSEIFKAVDSDIMVESIGSNTRLFKAISQISDDDNLYYVLVDNAADNPNVLREVRRIKSVIDVKNNVYMIKIHSFEFALLSFEMLEKWIFAESDTLLNDRRDLLVARKLIIDFIRNGGTVEQLSKLKKLLNDNKNTNTEKLCARLLRDITRNTGFETDKKQLGQCFYCDCCDMKNRQPDDICGLDKNRISADEKRRQLIDYSAVESALKEVGLYDNSI